MKIIVKLKDLLHKTKVKSKKLTYDFIEQSVQWLNRFNLKYMQDIISNDNKYNYEDLMPKIDEEKNKHYCETLKSLSLSTIIVSFSINLSNSFFDSCGHLTSLCM